MNGMPQEETVGDSACFVVVVHTCFRMEFTFAASVVRSRLCTIVRVRD